MTDRHHRDLYYSLYCLFVKRLGFTMYEPIGSEWLENKQWSIPSYANEYLNPFNPEIIEEGLYRIKCPFHGIETYGISYDRFMDESFDIIIPTFPAHYDTWMSMAATFKSKAKVIHHYGNVCTHRDDLNVIRSVPYIGNAVNEVLVNQEINTDIYSYTPAKPGNNIFAITNPYQFPTIFEQYRRLMTDTVMRYYGVGCPDGPLHGIEAVASKMQEANLGWSTKVGGGLGHTNMGWMYSGRPVVTNMSQHRMTGELAIELFEPGVTCIDVDAGTTEENCKQIRKWMDPDLGRRIGDVCHKRFHEVINYEQEAENVKQFLAKII